MSLFRKRSIKGDPHAEYQCTIRFLDDSEPIVLTFKKDTLGHVLFDIVCNKLNLVEKDYFGLRYVDADKQRHWLDPLKTVYKQLKAVNPTVLCFRVKFYPEDPMKLHEEITRYYLFLQLRRDLHHGRLLCSPSDANLLAAYIIQSEVGDYEAEDHPPGYVTEFKMLPKQNGKMEDQIMELHKTLKDQVPAEAESNFLKKASSLDTYGVDPHQVKDYKGTQLYLGVTHQGIMTFHGSRRTQLYKWSQIRRIVFEGKMFILHVNITEEEDATNTKKEIEEAEKVESPDKADTSDKVVSSDKADTSDKVVSSDIPQNEEVTDDKETHTEIKQQESATLPTTNAAGYLCTQSGPGDEEEKQQPIGYKCQTVGACKYLWRCAVEQQLFFTLDSSSNPPKLRSGGSLFSRGSKFRFSGRCQNEAYDASQQIKRDEPAFNRSASLPNFTRKSDSKPSLKHSTLVNETVREESPIDVQDLDSKPAVGTIPVGPVMKAPVASEEQVNITPEAEEPLQSTFTTVQEGSPVKANGSIPTSVMDTSNPDELPPYEPNNTILEDIDKDIIVKRDEEEEEDGVKVSLDDQIKILEEEIQKIDSMPRSNHVEPEPAAPVVPDVVQPAETKMEQTAPTLQENDTKHVIPPVAPKSGGASCCKVMILTFMFILVTLTVVLVVVLNSNVNHPVVNELRHQFKFVEPVRDYVIHKAHALFKS